MMKRKKLAGALLFALLSVGAMSSSVMARDPLYSPEGVTVTPAPRGESPKTGDINILAVEGIGLAAAGVAVVTATGNRKRSRA